MKLQIGFIGIEKTWDRNGIIIGNILSFIVALSVTNEN